MTAMLRDLYKRKRFICQHPAELSKLLSFDHVSFRA